MPWSFWLATAILAGSALTDLHRWWWWLSMAAAVAIIGIGIRARTDQLHYKSTTHKGEDHDHTSPMD